MRAPLLAGLVLLAALAGCARPAGDDAPLPSAPALPDGARLRDGTALASNATTASFAWRGSVGAGADAAETTLDIPGTVWTRVEVALRADADDARLWVLDEYGFVQCTLDDPDPEGVLRCALPEVAPFGWPRPWTIRVASAPGSLAGTAFEARVDVSAREGEPVEPARPAGLAEIVPFETRAADGVLLSGDVYLPSAPRPFPVVLLFTPYLNGAPGDQSEDFAMGVEGRRTMKWSTSGHLGVLLDAGYAVALVNLRGTGESGGCSAWFDLEVDGADAAAVIAALAAQPWSNGRVGMIGISWHGYSQYAALSAAPPALKAVAPASAILDPWQLWTRNGAPLRVPVYLTGAVFHPVWTLDNSGWLNLGDRSPEHLTCPDYATQLAEFEAISETGDETPFWERRRAHDAIAASRVPVLASNGLLSPQEGHILQARGLWPLLPAGSHLLVGQWGHEYPSEARSERYLRMVLDFFGEHLRGLAPRVAPGVSYQDADGAWWSAESWPPPGARERLRLSGEALLPDGAAVAASRRTFQTLEDEAPSASDCPFWVAYASEPLAEDLHLAGEFELSLPLTSTQPDGNLVAFLWAGDEVAACVGGERDARLVARAASDLRHRGGALRQGQPFPVGAEETLRLASHPFAATVPAGQRLILVVGGDDGDDELRDKALLPALTVRTGAGAEAWLDLPVVRRGA